MTIKNKIKSKANEIGFANIGFAKFELLDSEIKYYKEWLNKKYNASMDYLERTIDKRHNISLLLEGAKTIIVTATNYYQSMNYSNSIENVKIARYALGNDYHFVIKNMQNELINFIKAFIQMQILKIMLIQVQFLNVSGRFELVLVGKEKMV
jgi:epoxyqueuosine reductase